MSNPIRSTYLQMTFDECRKWRAYLDSPLQGESRDSTLPSYSNVMVPNHIFSTWKAFDPIVKREKHLVAEMMTFIRVTNLENGKLLRSCRSMQRMYV